MLARLVLWSGGVVGAARTSRSKTAASVSILSGSGQAEEEPTADDIADPEHEWEPQDEPERRYGGGRYCDLPRMPGLDRHHLVPAWNLDQAGRDPATGLAIQMDRADHMKTASWGRTPKSAKYRADIGRLLAADADAEALRKGIEDVEQIAPGKYSRALDEARNAER